MTRSRKFKLLFVAVALFLTLSSFTMAMVRPLIGWGDWSCTEETNNGLCWKTCSRTYYFIIAVDHDYWNGPCWQNPPE